MIYNSTYTFLGTNISPEKSILKMIFLFRRWDMLISWRVYIYDTYYVYRHTANIVYTLLETNIASEKMGFGRLLSFEDAYFRGQTCFICSC